MNELAKIDQRLPIYVSAAALLHVARKMATSSCSNELMDIVSIILAISIEKCSNYVVSM